MRRKLSLVFCVSLVLSLVLSTGAAFAKAPERKDSATSTTWYLAEGSTGADATGYFETFILVANPNLTNTNVTLTYQLETGSVTAPARLVPGQSRLTVNVKDDLASLAPVTGGKVWSVSTKVSADQPILAERAEYWTDNHVAAVKGLTRQAATECIGVAGTNTLWYLAEGSTHAGTDGSFETWILVQNPGTITAHVSLFYQTTSGEVAGPAFALQPGTRKSVSVGDTLPATDSISTRVTSDQPVVAERAMYWSNPIVRRVSGHDSVGVNAAAPLWYLPACSTAGWTHITDWPYVLVQNPGTTTANVTLKYMTTATEGVVASMHDLVTISLPSRSRYTFNVRDYVTSPGIQAVTAVILADQPVIAEKSVYKNYFDGRTSVLREQASGSNGLSVTSQNWLLAEGSTGTTTINSINYGFQTDIWICNPTADTATVNVTFLLPGVPVSIPTFSLPGYTLVIIRANDHVPNQWSVSTQVTANKALVTERVMYWSQPGVSGIPDPSMPVGFGDQASSVGVATD
jgi:hypothetical protein